jgi:hypothetical protein
MSTAKTYKKLRIFVASPKDVAAECARLHTVVEELNCTGNLADWLGLTLELLDWRTHIAPLMGRPEEVVLRQLPVETWDIFVGILWLRFGTPSGAADPQIGKLFDSGTQEEFSLAYNSWKKNGRPKVLFYRCTRVPASLDEIDHDQYKRVKDFFAQFDADAVHPGLPQSFQTAEGFERRVRADLTKLLLEYGKDVLNKEPPQSVVEYAAPKIPDTLPRRAPFFGRKDEIAQALRALSPEDRGWGLVIDGIGGIGKTALAVEAAYRCKERGLFDAFIFVSAKQKRLEPSGIKAEVRAATTLDEFVNETARALGQPGIAKLTDDDKRRALLDTLRTTRALLIYDGLDALT